MLSLYTPAEVQLKLADAFKISRKSKKHGRAKAALLTGVPAPTIRHFEQTGNVSIKQFLMLCNTYGDINGILSTLPQKKPATMNELIANMKDTP